MSIETISLVAAIAAALAAIGTFYSVNEMRKSRLQAIQPHLTLFDNSWTINLEIKSTYQDKNIMFMPVFEYNESFQSNNKIANIGNGVAKNVEIELIYEKKEVEKLISLFERGSEKFKVFDHGGHLQLMIGNELIFSVNKGDGRIVDRNGITTFTYLKKHIYFDYILPVSSDFLTNAANVSIDGWIVWLYSYYNLIRSFSNFDEFYDSDILFGGINFKLKVNYSDIENRCYIDYYNGRIRNTGSRFSNKEVVGHTSQIDFLVSMSKDESKSVIYLKDGILDNPGVWR